MLHYETVTPYLRNTLMRLMADSHFDSFRLVGGTALSLRLGHRMSIDIDLFYTDDFIGELCAEDGIRLASIGDIGQNKTVGNFTRAAISTMALGVGLCSGPVAAACVLGWGIFDLAVGDRVFNGW